jgi:hypothetical protein
MEIITLSAFLGSAQSLPLRKLTHIDSTYVKQLSKITKINRKFRVPRKQGAQFLDARAQIQDS